MSEGDNIQEDLRSQIEELTFSISSLKMDNQVLKEEGMKKTQQMKNINGELKEQNTQYFDIIV